MILNSYKDVFGGPSEILQKFSSCKPAANHVIKSNRRLVQLWQVSDDNTITPPMISLAMAFHNPHCPKEPANHIVRVTSC